MGLGITVIVYTRELEALQRFYEGALGVESENYGKWRPFQLASGTFALHAVEEGSGHDVEGFSITFEVDDIDEAVPRFEAHGAKILRGVADEAFGKRAVLQDPDGRQFEVVQHEM